MAPTPLPNLTTPFHSKYWAAALTLRGPSGAIESLTRSIANSRVDLNPHQVDAALFAIRSPLNKGVLLADEVGLGKTVEAGIVITQRWAERRRKILLILPATLRKQWQQELTDKFSLPSVILEGRSADLRQPDRIAICSYHFAAARADDIKQIPWDLVVVDEAHRLRNVWKTSSKIAQAIADAISHAPKVLMTATPLQNSLVELYGLVSILDPRVFGDIASFRDQFLGNNNDAVRNLSLKERLSPLCTRTLRKQVLEYIKFTQRIPLTQDFLPNEDEMELYRLVSLYLQRETLFALPAGQRTLLTLVLRKLLASSTFAIAGTLKSLVARLEAADLDGDATVADASADFDELPEIADEWPPDPQAELDLKPSPDLLKEELAELRTYAALAERIHKNSKGEALLTALATGLAKATALGAARKAVVFTESRRTQQYLIELLTASGFANRIVLINGDNADAPSKAIYSAWLRRNAGSSAISGSKTADMKAALVEEFRDRATVLIATESAAEGVNLQFCSLVINYDLPWNPQRIEQRIGRCHRYGQKHDVVVVNFLNRANAADQRVFELLAQKFRLFEGVFGASDEVLGGLESGVDLEKRIAGVYQNCRTESEIQAGFDQLQHELDEQIQSRMAQTRQLLLENFDEEVHERLKMRREEAAQALDRRTEWLLSLARQELGANAQWKGPARFHLECEYGLQPVQSGEARPQPAAGLTSSLLGSYNADWREAERLGDQFFRPDNPLAQKLIAEAFHRPLEPARVTFHYAAHGRKISTVQPYVGLTGWLTVARLTVDSFECEEHLLLAGTDSEGTVIDEDVARKFLMLPAACEAGTSVPAGHFAPPAPISTSLARQTDTLAQRHLRDVEYRNAKHFDEQVAKLDLWAEDLKSGLERAIKNLDAEIRQARKESGLAQSLEGKLTLQKKLRTLEQERTKKRRELFEGQDSIDGKRDGLISEIEAQMRRTHRTDALFTLHWTLAS